MANLGLVVFMLAIPFKNLQVYNQLKKLDPSTDAFKKLYTDNIYMFGEFIGTDPEIVPKPFVAVTNIKRLLAVIFLVALYDTPLYQSIS